MASRYILRAMKTSPRASGVSGGAAVTAAPVLAAGGESRAVLVSCAKAVPEAVTQARHAPKRTTRLRAESMRPPFGSILTHPAGAGKGFSFPWAFRPSGRSRPEGVGRAAAGALRGPVAVCPRGEPAGRPLGP